MSAECENFNTAVWKILQRTCLQHAWLEAVMLALHFPEHYMYRVTPYLQVNTGKYG